MNVFSDISIYWLLPIAVLAFVLSYLYYYNQKHVSDLSQGLKWFLISLRGGALFLIVLMLLGIIIERKVVKSDKPIFITMIDNSTSMLNYADSSVIKESIAEFQKQIKKQFPDKFDFETILIGSAVRSSNDFDFKDKISNLDTGFDYIYNRFYNKNIGAITFFSDGNFNEGMSPISSSKKIKFSPIYTVGIGDTIVKKDQLIRNVSYNSIAFYKNEFPVEIDVEGHKTGKIQTIVSLWRNGEKVDQKSIAYKNGESDFVHVKFSLLASSIGFSEFVVKVERINGESSYENNEQRFYVETIDSRNKILLLSYSPHPDIAAIKNELDKDENSDVESMLFSDFSGKVNGYSLVIVQNPKSDMLYLIDEIRSSRVPLLFLLGTPTQKNVVDQLRIGLKFPSGDRLDNVQVALNSSFQLFDVSDELKLSLSQWPPLSVKFGKTQTTNGSVFLHQKIGNISKKDPVIYFGSINQDKYGVVVGEGLWKWKINDYLAHDNVDRFNEFIQKTVQYLTVKKNNDPLRVNLPNRFTTSTDVLVNAEFYNSSFEKITKPTIHFNIKKNDKTFLAYDFSKESNRYSLNVGQLQEGKYSWVAKTSFNGVKHQKQGVFIVENTSLESISTHSNFTVLNQISTNSQARFVPLNKASSLMEDIKNRKDIVRLSYEESKFDDLIDLKYLFTVVILLLSVEWFIRRYSGGY